MAGFVSGKQTMVGRRVNVQLKVEKGEYPWLVHWDNFPSRSGQL